MTTATAAPVRAQAGNNRIELPPVEELFTPEEAVKPRKPKAQSPRPKTQPHRAAAAPDPDQTATAPVAAEITYLEPAPRPRWARIAESVAVAAVLSAVILLPLFGTAYAAIAVGLAAIGLTGRILVRAADRAIRHGDARAMATVAAVAGFSLLTLLTQGVVWQFLIAGAVMALVADRLLGRPRETPRVPR